MITTKQLEEIKSFLISSENPLFFFDDDADGLCSYLLLKKIINRGKGIMTRGGSHYLDQEYLRKVDEYKPDKIFILDKPNVDQEFINKVNVPVIWIDHHPVQKLKGVHYYNPLLDKNYKKRKYQGESVSYWCYKINQKDLWIGTCGSVSDWELPDYLSEFKKIYPDLVSPASNPGDLLFNSKLGELAKILYFILKGKTSDVNKSISILFRIESPYEIINQTSPRGKFLYKRAEKINKEYKKLVEKALETISKKHKLIIFIYPTTKTSLSSILSNELIYRFPDKVIIVAREKDDQMRISFRSSKLNLPLRIKKAAQGLDAHLGGHKNACGGTINKEDFHEFLKRFKKLM